MQLMENCTKAYIDSIQDPTLFKQLIALCANDYQMIDFVSLFYLKSERSFALIILITAVLLTAAFVNIKTVADSYLASVIGKLALELSLTPSLAAVTLIAMVDGIPDVINSILPSRAKPDRIELALGPMIAAFLFSSTLVVGNVLHRAHSKKLRVLPGPFLKEIGMYFFALSLIAFQAYIGEITTTFVIVYLLLYVLYLWLSFLLREFVSEEIISEKVHETLSGEDLEIHSTGNESRVTRSSFLLRRTFWSKESTSIGNFLMFPFRLFHLLTVPSEGLSNSTENSPLIRFFVFVIKVISSYFACALSMTFVFGFDLLLALKISLAVPLIFAVTRSVPALRRKEAYLVQFFCLIGSFAQLHASVFLILDSVFILLFLAEVDRLFVIVVVLSAGNTVGDFFTNGALADLGNEAMALLACFSSQSFSLLVGFWVTLLLRKTNDFDLFGWKSATGPSPVQICMRILFVFAFGSLLVSAFVGLCWKFGFVKGYRTLMFFYFFVFALIAIIFLA